jgi:hypothetical protein
MAPQTCWANGPLYDHKEGFWRRLKLETRSSSPGVGEGATVGHDSPRPMVSSGHHGGERDIGMCLGRRGRALSRVSLGHASLDREHTSRTCHHPFYGRWRVDGAVVGGANRRTHVAEVGREGVTEKVGWWGEEVRPFRRDCEPYRRSKSNLLRVPRYVEETRITATAV